MNNKKELITDTCHNMDEFKNILYTKKQDTKEHVFYDSIYMKCQKKKKPGAEMGSDYKWAWLVCCKCSKIVIIVA